MQRVARSRAQLPRFGEPKPALQIERRAVRRVDARPGRVASADAERELVFERGYRRGPDKRGAERQNDAPNARHDRADTTEKRRVAWFDLGSTGCHSRRPLNPGIERE